nr:SPOR domain-containing protein [Azonexus fungiphilus]
MERRPAGESTGWWVHIPPLANKAAADKKAQELKALGVSDYFVVQEGATRNAISLGIFSSEKGGRERLAELQAQGVRSAKLVPRPDKDGNQQIELRGPADRRAALLAALAEALPKTPPQDCP